MSVPFWDFKQDKTRALRPRAVKTLVFQRCEAMIPARCLDFVCHLQLELLPQKVFLQAKGGGGGGGLGGHGDGGDEEEGEERHHYSDVVNWGFISEIAAANIQQTNLGGKEDTRHKITPTSTSHLTNSKIDGKNQNTQLKLILHLYFTWKHCKSAKLP